MALLTNILLIASLFLSIALAMRTGANLHAKAMPSLFSIIIFFSVWVAGNLLELNATDFQVKLLGRNIEQIGVFFTPLSTLYFSIDYTSNQKLRRFALAISIVEAASVVLLLTDQWHHLMRQSISLVPNALLGNAIVVRSTSLGSTLVAFNFCLPLLSTANLIAFSRTVSAKLKRPLWYIISSMFATFVLALLQSSVLTPMGVNIPIPVLSLPCLIAFSYAVLREGFVGVAPTALSKVFEVIDQGIIVVDTGGAVLEFNRRACELMEYMLPGHSLKIGEGIAAYMAATSGDPAIFSAERLPAELKNAQRNQYIALAYHELKAGNRKLLGYVLVLTDITLLKVRAEIDFLTGSFNREGLMNAFGDLLKDPAQFPYLSALIVDLDDFKHINDTYGHLCGDVILCDFVGVAQSLLSEKRFLGRLGGDEFVVILPAELGEAAELAETLRTRIAERAVPYLDFTVRYTVSVGIATCKNEACSLSELLHQADLALYQAKREGKNAIHLEAADTAVYDY